MNAELYDDPKLICKITEENKRLRKLAFERCPLHGKFPPSENCQRMFTNGKCEGYSRSNCVEEAREFCQKWIVYVCYESEAQPND